MRHPTVKVRHNGGLWIDIDEKLAPLIKELWRRGITTCQSCQSTLPGKASITFKDLENLLNFLSLIADHTTYDAKIKYWDEGPGNCVAHRFIGVLQVHFPNRNIGKVTAAIKRKPLRYKDRKITPGIPGMIFQELRAANGIVSQSLPSKPTRAQKA